MNPKLRRVLAFSVPGKPISQGSMAHNRAGILYQKPEVVRWREKVQQVALIHARQAGLDLPLDEPVYVAATFYMPRPKHPKFEVPAVQPDLDKLQRAIGDALAPKHGQRVLQDDSRIVRWINPEKVYATAGMERAEIEIWAHQ